MGRLTAFVGVLACALTLAPAALAKPHVAKTPGDPRSPSAKCDDLDASVCLQPFPNNLFTKPSSASCRATALPKAPAPTTTTEGMP